MERTLFIIKPNAVRKNQIGEIISIIERNGLHIKKINMEQLSLEKAGEFYSVHRGKPFYEKLLDFMTSGPVVEMVLEHENCVEFVRKLIGCTDPSKAEPGTIRKMYAENVTVNAVHASDSPENAAAEIKFMFGNID